MFSWRFIEFLTILQILSIWSCIAQTADFPTDCDAFYNNSCFSYTELPYKDWSDANIDCATRDGYLTSVNSENENDMLADLTVKVTGDTGYNAWIGLDYNRYMLSTNWVDGTPITYSRTADTVGTSPLCIVITGTGAWRAFSCSDHRSYICRRSGESAFAIKLDNGQYEPIVGSDTTINTIPTTLVCRTDTYPLSTEIVWEYRLKQNEEWTDKQGSWNGTTGISELTISDNGYYRCHVKSGGSDRIYTATVMDPTAVAETTTTAVETTTTNGETTEPQITTTMRTLTTHKPENNTVSPSSTNCHTFTGVLITLIVFLIGLVALLVCIIICLLVCLRKQKLNSHQFKRIPEKDEKPVYQTIPEVKQKETKPIQYDKRRIAVAIGSSDYIPLSEVTNKDTAVDPPESNYYTPMAGVGSQDIDLKSQNSQYENIPDSGRMNTGEFLMGKNKGKAYM